MLLFRLMAIVMMAWFLVTCSPKSEPLPTPPVSLTDTSNLRTAGTNTILNVQTGKAYTELQKAFDELPAQFDKNYQIQISGSWVSKAVLQARNMGSYGLRITGVSGRAILDAGGTESALSFNGSGSTMGNITLENLEIRNYSQTSGATSAIRFTTIKGDNLLKNIIFTGGYVAMRATNNCGNITLEDVEMRNVRFGGPRFGLPVAPGQKDLGHVVFRRLKTTLDPSIPFPSDDICTLKGFESLLIEDCVFTGAAKAAVAIYEISNVTIRRNIFRQMNKTNIYAGAIDIQPAPGGTCNNVLIESNLFDKGLGSAIYAQASNLKITNNTIIESSVTRPVFSLENCGGTVDVGNNLFHGSNSNRAAFVSLYNMKAATVWKSDYNMYNKPVNSQRNIIEGGIGTKNLSGSTILQLKANGVEMSSMVATPTFNAGTDSKRPYWMLKSSSLGRDAGGNAYNNRDLLGNTVTGTPDIGAYDYDSFR